MMPERPILAVDFGSTFTKVRLIETTAELPLTAAAQSPSTVLTDAREGLLAALREGGLDPDLTAYRIVASSSAAGGLRIVASGLMPQLTAKAAQMAALSAGARVLQTFSHRLTVSEARQIADLMPDIVLLAGGTDGGDRATVVHNAERLRVVLPAGVTVIYAGNKEVADDVAGLLEEAGVAWEVVPNVMPEYGVLNVDPAQTKIREVFLHRIIDARGLAQFRDQHDVRLTPTPHAVFRAAELISTGHDGEPGLGPVLAIDVGGATTDVYSVCDPRPKASRTYRGLRVPWASRTVEGDLGMHANAVGVVAHIEETGAATRLALTVLQSYAEVREQRSVPAVPRLESDDQAASDIASIASLTAVERHAGTLEVVATPQGTQQVVTGKDLSGVGGLVLTGGVFAHHPDLAARVAGLIVDSTAEKSELMPDAVTTYLDVGYSLFAIGLIADSDPAAGMRLARQTFRQPVSSQR